MEYDVSILRGNTTREKRSNNHAPVHRQRHAGPHEKERIEIIAAAGSAAAKKG